MDEEWARNIRDLCAAKHIPFYFKQHSGRYSQIGKKLDGVEHKQYLTAWDKYVPALQNRIPGQVQLLDAELNIV